jgi:hypothetical protein
MWAIVRHPGCPYPMTTAYPKSDSRQNHLVNAAFDLFRRSRLIRDSPSTTEQKLKNESGRTTMKTVASLAIATALMTCACDHQRHSNAPVPPDPPEAYAGNYPAPGYYPPPPPPAYGQPRYPPPTFTPEPVYDEPDRPPLPRSRPPVAASTGIDSKVKEICDILERHTPENKAYCISTIHSYCTIALN